MLTSTPTQLFYTANFFSVFLEPYSFSVLKFLIRILLFLLIVPLFQIGIKYDDVHKIFNRSNIY